MLHETETTWNKHPYDQAPANRLIAPATLIGYVAETPYSAIEEARRAAFLLELAVHPDLTQERRQSYAEAATAAYDELTSLSEPHKEPELYLRHAFLPLLQVVTLTDRKKANRVVNERSKELAAALEGAYKPDETRSSNFLLGFGAELLALTSLPKMGFRAFPSLTRHDNGVTKVDGLRYAWDVLANPLTGSFIGSEYHIQVKHRDPGAEALQRDPYHPAIVLHAVFPNSSWLNPEQPAVFGLIRQALQMGGKADPRGYRIYQDRLRKDLARHPQPSKMADERLFILP